ncbi:MAG: hypothetical protein AAGF87_00370 [Bacteroidota bacterium]
MIKKLISLTAILLIVPTCLCAQEVTGNWAMSGTAPDGQAYNTTISFHADGTMSVDMGNDGSIDIQANYTHADGQMSISDIAEQSPCYGKTGVYSISLNGDQMTVALVDDPCDARRIDRMVLTRKQ